MKTPEEIKRAINTLGGCRDLITYDPFTGEDIDPMFLNEENRALYDAIGVTLAYIQQIERDNAQKDERIRKLEREKETLLAGIKLHGGICMMCKYYSTPEYELPCGNCCVIYPNDREAENLWEWRGVEEEQ